jgi:hypothetical protein
MNDMLRHVLGIGWDVGGWIGRRQGVAIVEWNDHSPRWLGKQTCFSIGELGEHWGVDDLVCFAWPEARSGILEDRELVLAIDAPLGFPVAFSELLAGRFAPSFDTKPEIGNRLAYRETDRHVYRTLGKKPLSASFDKLGNNATVAMVHTRRLSNTGQLRVVPFDKPQKPIPTAIEVYPALSKKPKKRGDKSAAECLPALRGLLPPEARNGTDECDACLCALLALAYGHDGRTRSLPRLQGPTETTAEIKQEGWIFYPAPNWATTRTEQSVRKT